jgi:hypothetical protein
VLTLQQQLISGGRLEHRCLQLPLRQAHALPRARGVGVGVESHVLLVLELRRLDILCLDDALLPAGFHAAVLHIAR